MLTPRRLFNVHDSNKEVFCKPRFENEDKRNRTVQTFPLFNITFPSPPRAADGSCAPTAGQPLFDTSVQISHEKQFWAKTEDFYLKPPPSACTSVYKLFFLDSKVEGNNVPNLFSVQNFVLHWGHVF